MTGHDSRDGIEVSVVIPTHNRATRLLRTMETVLAQEDVNFEVVVVDDGSSRDTAARMRAIESTRVRVIRHHCRRGLPAARNSGIAVAQGHWVAFVDDDDLWSPSKLRTQLAAAAAANAGWVYGGSFVLDETFGPLAGPPVPDPALVFDYLLAGNPIPAGGSNIVAQTDVLLRLGGFDVRVSHLADWDMFLRLARSVPAAACSETVVAYVTHESNMRMDADVGAIVREIDYLGEKHSALRSSTGGSFDDRLFWEWLLTNQQRAGRRLSAGRLLTQRALRHRSGSDLRRAAHALLQPSSPQPPSTPCQPPAWAAAYG